MQPVDRLTVHVVVDNTTDMLSSRPKHIASELRVLRDAGMTELAGEALCSAHHAASNPLTVAVACSGSVSGFHTEWIRGATDSNGEPFHKVYCCAYEISSDGLYVREDVTDMFSSSENSQVCNHHQSPQQTRERLGLWPGFDFL